MLKSMHLQLIALGVVSATLIGCGEKQPMRIDTLNRRTEMNRWITRSYQNDAIRNAIIRERTLYPHHFETDSQTLNTLGMRNIRILASHYKALPGSINVRRGSESPIVYQGRVDATTSALASLGVDTARVIVADGPLDGAGANASRTINILDAVNTPGSSVKSSSSSSSSSSKGSSK